MWNVHRMFIMSITHIYNIGIPKHKTTYNFLVQVWNFLLPLSLKVFRLKERGTIFLCWLFHLPTPHHHMHTCCQALASKWKSTFSRRQNSTLTFSNLPKSSAHASGVWRHSHPPVTIFHLGFLFWHLWITHPTRMRMNTCAHVAPN